MENKKDRLKAKEERLRLAVERARESGDNRRMSLMSIYRRKISSQIKEIDKAKTRTKTRRKTFSKIVRPVK